MSLPMRKNIGCLFLISFICSCCSEQVETDVKTTSLEGRTTEQLFTSTFSSAIPDIDSTFVLFHTGTADQKLFIEIVYKKKPYQKAKLYLYTKEFFGNTIDSCMLEAGLLALGKPFIEVNTDRSITLLDSQNIELTPCWIEIESESGENVSVMCLRDTTICCTEVIYKIGANGRISSSDPNGVYRWTELTTCCNRYLNTYGNINILQN